MWKSQSPWTTEASLLWSSTAGTSTSRAPSQRRMEPGKKLGMLCFWNVLFLASSTVKEAKGRDWRIQGGLKHPSLCLKLWLWLLSTISLIPREYQHSNHSFFAFPRSPPRPSPGGLHYSDEDICNKYNGAVLTEGLGLSEKPLEVSESEVRISLCLTLHRHHR